MVEDVNKYVIRRKYKGKIIIAKKEVDEKSFVKKIGKLFK